MNEADSPMTPEQLTRPKVAEHSFHLFGRSIHPELFQTYQRRIIDRENYWARIDITSEGHIAVFKSGSVTMSEVVCSASQQLPTRREIVQQSFRRKKSRLVELRHNIGYQTQFELEKVSPEFYWIVFQQLSQTEERTGLCQVFRSDAMLPYGAFSYILIEERPRSLLVQSLHTFPEDCLLLKSFTTFVVKD
jgi:hypothetical protein